MTDQQEQPSLDEWMAEGEAWLDYGLQGKEGLRSWIARALREIRRLEAENASLRERVEELESGIRLQGGPCSEWDREVT